MANLHLNFRSDMLMRSVYPRVFLPDYNDWNDVPPPYRTLYFLHGYSGGALETVRGLGIAADGERPTGLFFAEQTVASLAEAVERFEANAAAFSPAACRANALRFSAERFRLELAKQKLGQKLGPVPN